MPATIENSLAFLKSAEKIKCTLRSAYTSSGRQESTGEHTWRLCLMAIVFEKEFRGIDFTKVLKMCIIHDLGEAINGDIPAPAQAGKMKSDQERQDFITLIAPLDAALQKEFLTLWDEYENASSPEAVIVKGLDKLETILQHNQGKNPPGFDYAFNLAYGQKYTAAHPLLAGIRALLDEETRAHAASR